MLYQIGVALRTDAFFTASKQGKTGLTVTCDVYNHAGTKVVTDGAVTEIGGGFYTYQLAADLNTGAGHYRFEYKTADSTVDAQQVPALCVVGENWVERVDVASSTIKSKTDNLPSDPADQSAVEAAITAAVATLPTVTDIENAVLDSLAADHNLPDTIGEAINNAGDGNVTVVAHVAVSQLEAQAIASGQLGFVRYYSFGEGIQSTTTEDLAGATEIWLALKQNRNDLDASSILLVSKTVGLEILNGATYGTAGDASLLTTGTSGDWHIDTTVSHDVTPSLPLGTYYAEVKALLADGRTIQAWAGKAKISEGLIKATV